MSIQNTVLVLTFVFILFSCSEKNANKEPQLNSQSSSPTESQPKETSSEIPQKATIERSELKSIGGNNTELSFKNNERGILKSAPSKKLLQPDPEKLINSVINIKEPILSPSEEAKTKQSMSSSPTEKNLKPADTIPSDEMDELFSIKFFSGFNYFLFNQTANIETENGNFSQQTLSQIGFNLNMNLNRKTNIEFTHRQIEAIIPTQGETNLDYTSTNRTITSFDVNYLFKKIINSSYSAIIGLRNALIPALSTDLNNSIVNVYYHELTSVSIGIKYNYQLKKDSEIFAKSQFFKLIEGKSKNKLTLNIRDAYQFGVSVGANKRITKLTEVGFEIEHNQGQLPYHHYRNGTDTNGEFNLQDTSVLLKIGFHF